MNRQDRRRQMAGARRNGVPGPQPATAGGAGTAQELFARAVAHHQAGRLDEAKALYDQILAAVPDQPDTLHALGLLHQQRGEGAQAIALLKRAANLRPRSAPILVDLGGVHLTLGELDAAAERFAQAAAIEPRLAAAHYNLGLVRIKQRDPEQAIGSFESAVRLAPDDVTAQLMLGNALDDAGRGEEAIAQYRKLAHLVPSLPQVWYNLGLSLKAKERFEEAVEAFRRAIACNPGLAAGHNNLGTTLLRLRRLEEAAQCFERALGLQPDSAEAHNNMGVVLRERGRLDEAEGEFRRAISLDPNFADAHGNLGNLLMNCGDRDAAARHLQRAVALDPKLADAQVSFGSVLLDLGYLEQAADHLRQALALKPDGLDAHIKLGSCLGMLGKTDEAITHLRRALSLDPDNADAHGVLGTALAFAGRFEESTAAFDRALAIRPALPLVLYGRVGNSKRHHTEGEAARLRAVLSDETIPAADKAPLYFALGQIYETLGDYARSFEYYRQGNELVRADLPFDRAAWRAEIDALIETFTEDFFLRRRALGSDSDVPIFIFGMPRSGTTLVEQILSSHPRVAGGGELMHFPRITGTLQESFGLSAPYPKGAAELGIAQASEIVRYYLGRLQQEHPGSARVTDKLPANFLHLGLIALLFPGATFIHCRRDPLDTCLSCYFLTFHRTHPYAYDLQDLAFYYREYRRLMAHWRHVLPVRMLEVDYEDLAVRQEEISRRLIDHCGLEWDDRCLDFHNSDRSIQTASLAQVRQPVYRTSVERWQRYEPFLGPLRAALAGNEDVAEV